MTTTPPSPGDGVTWFDARLIMPPDHARVLVIHEACEMGVTSRWMAMGYISHHDNESYWMLAVRVREA